ncbi:hypothetical protein ACFSTC_45245 [Nonomuraea ferruginea]
MFAAAPPAPDHLRPRPTLGCSGSPARFARPGGNAPGLEPGEWAGYASRVQEAVRRCRDAGFEPAFHHHLGTYVETPRGRGAAAGADRRAALPRHRPPAAGRGRPGDRAARLVGPDRPRARQGR